MDLGSNYIAIRFYHFLHYHSREAENPEVDSHLALCSQYRDLVPHCCEQMIAADKFVMLQVDVKGSGRNICSGIVRLR